MAVSRQPKANSKGKWVSMICWTTGQTKFQCSECGKLTFKSNRATKHFQEHVETRLNKKKILTDKFIVHKDP